MRSVVVVLPASMCAMMPMFRSLGSGVILGMIYFATLVFSPVKQRPRRDPSHSPPAPRAGDGGVDDYQR